MTYLEMYRIEARKYNAAVRKEKYRRREQVRKAKWQCEHRDIANACRRAFVERTGFDEAAYLREWRKNHPGKQAEYNRRHRAKVRAAKMGGAE